MHFAKTPDNRPWPLVERSLFEAETISVLSGCFDAAFAGGLEKEGGHNSVSFGHVVRTGNRAVTDRAISSVLADGGGPRLRWLLGDRLAFLVDNCSLRYQEQANAESRLGFHFDADFIGMAQFSVNLWVPLDPVGESAPGLTFLNPQVDGTPLLNDWRNMVKSSADPRRPLIRGRFTADYVTRIAHAQGRQPFLTPVLQPGDPLMFNQFVLHATQVMEGAHALRRSLEFRVAAAGAIPSFYAARGSPVQHWSWENGHWTADD